MRGFRRLATGALGGVLVACGGVTVAPDAAPPVDAAAGQVDAPAATRCDPSGLFARPVPLLTVDGYAIAPRLSPDELTLYYQGESGNSDLYVTQRPSRSEPFATPILLGLSTAAQEGGPTVSSDGRTLLYSAVPVLGEGSHLYVATRSSILGEFGNPSKAMTINSTTITEDDGQPFLTADGQELWFASDRAGGAGHWDLYRAATTSSGFQAPTRVAELSSADDEWLPALSADRLTVYYSSNRADPGGQGGFDIWMSRRAHVGDEFPPPVRVLNVNTAHDDYVGWLSPDDCRLYLASDVTGDRDFVLLVASRTLP
jgi:Tol biopolymer transport system component